MSKRIAACLALTVFAVCLIVGIQSGNPFSTTVLRALQALLGTLVIGLVVGTMAQKMLDENLQDEEKKLKISSAQPDGTADKVK